MTEFEALIGEWHGEGEIPMELNRAGIDGGSGPPSVP
jgi:hypothetical protein